MYVWQRKQRTRHPRIHKNFSQCCEHGNCKNNAVKRSENIICSLLVYFFHLYLILTLKKGKFDICDSDENASLIYAVVNDKAIDYYITGYQDIF